MNEATRRSYAWCQRVAREKAANFYHAFGFLPRDQRLAMCALYAFMRVTDDVTDEPGETEAKRRALETWRSQFDAMMAGKYTHDLHAAFHHTVNTFCIPREYLDGVLAGVAMDLEPTRYDTFESLYRYCYRVASVVGLACIHIWGFQDAKAKEYAEAAGIAFQLTNILRDLKEDADRGRVYLPAEDLDRFGYSPEQLTRGERNDAFRKLMEFEAERAYHYYDASLPLVGLLPRAGRTVFVAMARTYQGLLDEIVRRDYDVFSERVRLSRMKKWSIVLRALPMWCGWSKGISDCRFQI